MFQRHPYWQVRHTVGVWREGNGRYYMFHQGRLLSPENQPWWHIREIFLMPKRWLVVSPERYAGTKSRRLL